MAKHYPRHSDPSMQKDVQYILDWVQQRGVDIEGKKIIDIGCGTGTIAITLASQKAHVTAVDFVPLMIETLQKDIKGSTLESLIETHISSWDDFTTNKHYDIAIASMTPAICDTNHIDKMLNISDIGIYVGWGSYKKNSFVDALLQRHDALVQKSQCIRFDEFENYIRSKNLSYCDFGFFETSWQKSLSADESKQYALSQLKRRNITPNESIIEELLQHNIKDNQLTITTQAEKFLALFSLSLSDFNRL